MNWRECIQPLRLMIVDDELDLQTNKLKQALSEACNKEQLSYEIIGEARAVQAQETLQRLKREGKKVHAIAMDYSLNSFDIRAIPFLVRLSFRVDPI